MDIFSNARGILSGALGKDNTKKLKNKSWTFMNKKVWIPLEEAHLKEHDELH